jgi:hypothetical protein
MASIKNHNNKLKAYFYINNDSGNVFEEVKSENDASKLKIKLKKSSNVATVNTPIRPTKSSVILTPRENNEVKTVDFIKKSVSTASLITKDEESSSINTNKGSVVNILKKLGRKRHNSLVTKLRSTNDFDGNFTNGLSSSMCFDSIDTTTTNDSLIIQEQQQNDTSIVSTSSKKSSFFNKKFKNILNNINRSLSSDRSVSMNNRIDRPD